MASISVNPLSFPAALAGVDFAAAAADLDGIFRKHGATTQATPLDLTFREGRVPTVAMASFVLESDRIARAVVTHVRAAPFFTGLALVIHPRPGFDAPLLVADVTVPPPGVTRGFMDACGPGVTAPGFASRFREPLSAALDAVRDVGHAPVPAWIAPLSGGCGGTLRAPRKGGAAVVRALTAYVDAYLGALASADEARDPAVNAARARSVGDAVRANAPAGKYLARAFGAAYATSYLQLLWRTDARSSAS